MKKLFSLLCALLLLLSCSAAFADQGVTVYTSRYGLTMSTPGAYAMYLNDVRASRVCESIDELRGEVRNSASNMQSGLLHALNIINNNLLYEKANTDYLLISHNAYVQRQLNTVEQYLLSLD